MANYAAALDQGTTSSRAMVFDHSGKVVSVSQKEHEQIYPKPGWVEHDAKEIWARSQEVLDEALEKAGASASDISGLGIRDTQAVNEITLLAEELQCASQGAAATMHDSDPMSVICKLDNRMRALVQRGFILERCASDFDHDFHSRPSSSGQPWIRFIFWTA